MSKENSQESLKPEPIVFGSFSVRMIEEPGGLRLEANEKEVFLPNDIAQISDPESIRDFFCSLRLDILLGQIEARSVMVHLKNLLKKSLARYFNWLFFLEKSVETLKLENSSQKYFFKSRLEGTLSQYKKNYFDLEEKVRSQADTILGVLGDTLKNEDSESSIAQILSQQEEEISRLIHYVLGESVNFLEKRYQITNLLKRGKPVGKLPTMIESIEGFLDRL